MKFKYADLLREKTVHRQTKVGPTSGPDCIGFYLKKFLECKFKTLKFLYLCHKKLTYPSISILISMQTSYATKRVISQPPRLKLALV